MPLGKPETVESRKDKAQGVIMVDFAARVCRVRIVRAGIDR
jgi:hypothetical protein